MLEWKTSGSEWSTKLPSTSGLSATASSGSTISRTNEMHSSLELADSITHVARFDAYGKGVLYSIYMCCAFYVVLKFYWILTYSELIQSWQILALAPGLLPVSTRASQPTLAAWQKYQFCMILQTLVASFLKANAKLNKARRCNDRDTVVPQCAFFSRRWNALGDRVFLKHELKNFIVLVALAKKEESSSLYKSYCRKKLLAGKIVRLASSNKAFYSASSAVPRSLREEPSRNLLSLLTATPFLLQAWPWGTASAISVTAADRATSVA